MTYFAIGEDNGGAGEKRLGPFPTPEEAAQAGRKETKDSNGAFVFRGVVDEANNQVGFDIEPIVSTNSVVRNAMAANRRVARNAEEDNYYLLAKKSIEDAGKLLASAVISLSRSKAPNAEAVHAELTKMGDMFERMRKRI